MNKITKEHIAERARLIAALESAESELTSAIDKFNDTLSGMEEDVREALNSYNELVASAKELADTVQSEIQEYIDERSEKWQESDRGQSYIAWADSFENLSLEEAEIEFPASIEAPSFDARAGLEQSFDEEFPG